jgi:hypothetical protein
MPVDRLQKPFAVGDIVMVPIVVTAVGGSDANPTVTGTTKYVGFDGNTDSIGPVDAIQTVYLESLPRS